MLPPRHIQDFSEDSALEYHWGYSPRQVPCLNDAGSCEYLDAVYDAHDVGMLYSFILWAVILGILFLWVLGRHLFPLTRVTTSSKEQLLEGSRPRQNAFYRLGTSAKALGRRYLLPESFTGLFGHTTRLQILVLVILTGYLTIFTFAGIVYKTWVTPVKNTPGLYNTRTGLGPWSDRIGVFAFALTPLSVLLSSRESLLSLVTGIPYHHFMFLHRWLGYLIFIQSALHTLGWTIVEARLYQPQPTVWDAFIAQVYIIWGVVAMIFLSFLVAFSTQWGIRLTGYEFFRKAHYVVAMLYIGACWGHWSQLSCWMIASLTVWFFDRGVRLARTLVLHHRNTPHTTSAFGLHIPRARMAFFPRTHDGDVIRLDFDHNHDEWQIGQHYFLCFPELSIWQSHPMTPCNVPGQNPKTQDHTYIIRSRKGLTKGLAAIAQQKENASTSVVLSGPYGLSILGEDFYLEDDINVLCVAGGTGVTFVLPVLLALIAQHQPRRGIVELIWAIRRKADMEWIECELQPLRKAAAEVSNFRIRIFVTRGDGEVDTSAVPISQEPARLEESKEAPVAGERPSSLSSSPSEMKAETFAIHELSSSASLASGHTRHPDLATQVTEFVSRTVSGPTRVVASGPLSMIRDLRSAVASCNQPGHVWRGDERYDVQLIHDDRLES
ncbi:hypothetical protein P175DRAFT_0533386 [Aspergillus ochraceoroseus IBT 24754]|uniref:FAD-binding FR-type domain-containing protein n=1 Tax=Aspergillus ochraceoroseus IBT 24754 TaxID=1392256 RepID=A0A2T5LVU5_9EURO|nr:uncharacterized protein P175DRAFT_0533386 [Aspergillus ochraceoroseus IBT 24754]PTU20383.1 hypothetical protein P175DRAFT_0533386 [Aspergillus ochraceoroseus IBT 24754]